MTINELEKQVAEKHAATTPTWGVEERTYHLVEEVGELFEILLHVRGAKQPSKDRLDITVALADVLEDLCAVAREYNVPLSDVANEAAARH